MIQTDLRSLILIQITPKKCTHRLNKCHSSIPAVHTNRKVFTCYATLTYSSAPLNVNTFVYDEPTYKYSVAHKHSELKLFWRLPIYTNDLLLKIMPFSLSILLTTKLKIDFHLQIFITYQPQISKIFFYIKIIHYINNISLTTKILLSVFSLANIILLSANMLLIFIIVKK